MKSHLFFFITVFVFISRVSVGNNLSSFPIIPSDSSFQFDRFVLGFDFALTNQYSTLVQGSKPFYNKTIRFPSVSYKLNNSTLVGIRFSKKFVPKNVKEFIDNIKSVNSVDFSIKYSFLSQFSLRPYLVFYTGFGTQNAGYGSFDQFGQFESKNRLNIISLSSEPGLSYFFDKNISLNVGIFYLKQFETLIIRPLKNPSLSSLKPKKYSGQTNSIGFNFGTSYYFKN